MTHEIKLNKAFGYLWMSDMQKPKVLQGEANRTHTLTDGENPFVVEGMLFDGETSTSIKYVDGKYIVKETVLADLDALNGVKSTEQEYVPSTRMKLADGKKLLFRQYWRPVTDDLCENMDVLQPAELVFVGFKK